MHTLLTEQSLGARLANTFLASPETLGCPIAYDPQVRWPESEGRMDYRDEKRRHLDPDFLGHLDGCGDPGLLRILLSPIKRAEKELRHRATAKRPWCVQERSP
jgi:hypothetical protein